MKNWPVTVIQKMYVNEQNQRTESHLLQSSTLCASFINSLSTCTVQTANYCFSIFPSYIAYLAFFFPPFTLKNYHFDFLLLLFRVEVQFCDGNNILPILRARNLITPFIFSAHLYYSSHLILVYIKLKTEIFIQPSCCKPFVIDLCNYYLCLR